MSKTLRKILCCSMALIETSPMLVHTLSASARSRVHATGYYALPKYLKTNLDDYYGHNVAIRIYNTNIARTKAEDFENLWKSFNANKGVQKHYGHVSKRAYTIRLRNERYIDSGIDSGKSNSNNLQFYGWLNKSLSKPQKNAIKRSEPAKGLTKTQKMLLNKYGITNQIYARNNFGSLSNANYTNLKFPFEAHLSAKQQRELHNNHKLHGFSKKTRNILSHYGIPVENGKTPEASYNDYLKSLMTANARVNGYKGPNENNQTNADKSNTIDNDITEWSKAANKGADLPKQAIIVAVDPKKHKSQQVTILPRHPNADRDVLDALREGGYTQIKLAKDISKPTGQNKDNGEGNENNKDTAKLADEYIPAAKVLPKDNQGHYYYDAIINGKSVRFTLDNGHVTMSGIDGTHLDSVPATDTSNPSASDNDSDNPSDGSDQSDNYGGDYSDESDDNSSDGNSDEQDQHQSDNGNGYDINGNTGNYSSDSDQLPESDNGAYSDGSSSLDSDVNSDNNSDTGMPNIFDSNQKAIAKAKREKQAAEKAKEQALQKVRSSQYHHTSSSEQQRNKAIDEVRQAEAAKNVAQHNMKAATNDSSHEQDVLAQIRSNDRTDNQDRNKLNEEDTDAEGIVVRTVNSAINATPGMSKSARKRAERYFKKHPSMLKTPSKVKNKDAKLFLKYASLSPSKAVLVSDPQSASVKYKAQTKNNKKAPGKTFTNNASEAAQIKQIHALYNQINQLEKQIHVTHHKTARVESIENLPYDGYSKTLQAYGNYLISNKPNDLPNAKPIVTTDQIKRINKNSGNINKFWIATQKASTTDGNTYYHVISMNGNVSGWINSKGLDAIKVSKTKLPVGGYPAIRAVKKEPRTMNPAFVDAYENMLQRYIMGDKQVQKIARHKFNKHQISLDHMYAGKDLKGKDKALDNIARRFQDFIILKMQIPQYNNEALNQSKLLIK